MRCTLEAGLLFSSRSCCIAFAYLVCFGLSSVWSAECLVVQPELTSSEFDSNVVLSDQSRLQSVKLTLTNHQGATY